MCGNQKLYLGRCIDASARQVRGGESEKARKCAALEMNKFEPRPGSGSGPTFCMEGKRIRFHQKYTSQRTVGGGGEM